MTQHSIILIILTFTITALLLSIVVLIYNKRKYKALISQLKNMANFKEQTANMIIHDLKVPIATLMNIELISDEGLQRKMVKQASKRMMLLVQNVLDVYKYENTKIKIKKERIKINQLIAESIDDFKLMAEIKKITFNTTFDGDTPIVADPLLLLRVFSNILSNAIKFSPNNGIIEISTSKNKNYLNIKFRNQGPGIPKQQQTVIFDRFEQAQVKNFGKLPSTGLGLTFCNIVLKAHKGEIGVNSDNDIGAEFWIKLPC